MDLDHTTFLDDQISTVEHVGGGDTVRENRVGKATNPGGRRLI